MSNILFAQCNSYQRSNTLFAFLDLKTLIFRTLTQLASFSLMEAD